MVSGVVPMKPVWIPGLMFGIAAQVLVGLMTESLWAGVVFGLFVNFGVNSSIDALRKSMYETRGSVITIDKEKEKW